MEQKESPNDIKQVSPDTPMSFGRYLKKIRHDNGLTIEDIMNETRISKYVIQQIEAENYKNLPEEVYLKGFLKAYAEALGVDPFDVLEKYNVSRKWDENRASQSKKEGRGSTVPISSIKLWISVAIIVVGLIFLGVFYGKTNHGNAQVIPTDDTVSQEAEVAAGEADTAETVVEDEPQLAAPQGVLHLEVICLEDTTLKVATDGGMPEEYILKQEDHLELKAEKMYTILIDDACGVSMLLNNNSVAVPGKCGQTATIQLP